eukprot:TRINITY_DN7166_c0_g1_i4.p4 TRINITY_DN7166_c0_g1~~TRINITY_DN7166_c0_g1_i4.p4  ORF type:complete len:118 (-),score=21.57 TRINITY_DN7166_c0_g1_i4:1133-1486(-)
MSGQAVAKQLMDQRIRVYTIDGRVLEGELRCIDQLGNLVLVDSINVRPQLEQQSLHQNSALGVVIVPKAQRRKVEVIMAKQQAEEFVNLAQEAEFAVECKQESWEGVRAEMEALAPQ